MLTFIISYFASFLFFASLFLLLTFKLYKPYGNKALVHKFHKAAFVFASFEGVIVALATLL